MTAWIEMISDQDAADNTIEDRPLLGQNQWPDFVPDMQQHAMEYFRQVQGVALHQMHGFALDLGLEQDFFVHSCSSPISCGGYLQWRFRKAFSYRRF